jgi:cellulose synthase/poly-beta-1,6-N-acetylglucosamine synthase-like glycosyltransferase
MENLFNLFDVSLMLWALFTLTQLVFLAIVAVNVRSVKSPSGNPIQTPLVSVLIPLRNESDNVNDLIQTLTQQDYPNLEILLLDDQSEDDTWLKLLSMQWLHPTLLLYQGKALPEGWLGKNFACHQPLYLFAFPLYPQVTFTSLYGRQWSMDVVYTKGL